MPIPKYDEMYRAYLQCLADGRPHYFMEVKEKVAAAMNVTREEQRQMMTNRPVPLFDNRIGWTRTYLKKAGLIDSPARGCYVITQEGRAALANTDEPLDNAYLRRYPSFCEFLESLERDGKAGLQSDSNQTPQDALESAVSRINAALVDDVLSEVLKQSPAFFEHLIIKLLSAMGYGAVENSGVVTGHVGDEGIDGIVREDKLGFNLIYIQAKRWDRAQTVGRPEIQKFVGALAGQGASKGLFVTTARFSTEAEEYARKQHTTKVVLIDGKALARLMIEYNVGVSTEATYEVKRLDTDFFDADHN